MRRKQHNVVWKEEGGCTNGHPDDQRGLDNGSGRCGAKMAMNAIVWRSGTLLHS